MTEEEILAILLKFADYLQIGDIWMNGFRSIGMLIVRGLVYFVDLVSGNFAEVTSVLNFRNNDAVSDILAALQPIQSMLLGFAILIIGLVLFFGKNTEMRSVPLNSFLIICALSMLPGLLTDGVRLTEAISSEMTTTNESLGLKTVKNNVKDIYELGAAGWTTEDPETDNHLEDLKFFDVNERIEDPDEVDPDGVLEYRAINKKGGTGYELKKMDEGGNLLDSLIKKMVSPTYYRWKINWIPIFITLIALALAVGLFVIRAGRLGIEVVFNYIWTNVTAFFHIRDLRKFKQAFTEIFVGLIGLASMFVLFYLYIAYNTYISNGDRNVLIQALLYVGGAWLLFDGPAIIQKQLGIDAGLSTAGGVLTSMGAAKAANLAINSAEKVANTGSGIFGILAGIRQGRKESNDDSDSTQDQLEGKGINPSVDKDKEPSKEEGSGGSTGEENKFVSSDSDQKEELDTKEESASTDESKDQVEVKDDTDSGDLETGNYDPANDSEEENTGINDQIEKQREEQSNGGSNIQEDIERKEEEGEKSANPATNDHEEKGKEKQGINDKLDSKDQNSENTTNGISNQVEPEKQEKIPNKKTEQPDKPDSDSHEKDDKPKEPVKPQNPLHSFAKEKLMTPKSAKYNKSAVGNLYESHEKGKALGSDLVQYTRARKAYKKEKRSIKDLKE